MGWWVDGSVGVGGPYGLLVKATRPKHAAVGPPRLGAADVVWPAGPAGVRPRRPHVRAALLASNIRVAHARGISRSNGTLADAAVDDAAPHRHRNIVLQPRDFFLELVSDGSQVRAVVDGP